MNPLHPITPEFDDELNWLAFRYVAGELTEEQTESFEARLADDLAACEAVAAMSELAVSAQSAAAVEKSERVRVAESPHKLRVRIRSWIAIGSTVVALGWLFLLSGNRSDRTEIGPAGPVTRSDAQTAADLIARWSQSEESEFTSELPEIAPLDLNGAGDSGRPDIPTWMIAAVSLENAASRSDDVPDMPSDRKPVETKEN